MATSYAETTALSNAVILDPFAGIYQTVFLAKVTGDAPFYSDIFYTMGATKISLGYDVSAALTTITFSLESRNHDSDSWVEYQTWNQETPGVGTENVSINIIPPLPYRQLRIYVSVFTGAITMTRGWINAVK